MMVDAKLFGRGMAFPPRLDSAGRVRWSTGPVNVREAIKVILMTDPGERLMRPSFGGGLRSFLFEPNVADTHRLIEERVAHALARWEPRIKVGSIAVDARPDDPQLATVTVTYTLVATQAVESVGVEVRLGG